MTSEEARYLEFVEARCEHHERAMIQSATNQAHARYDHICRAEVTQVEAQAQSRFVAAASELEYSYQVQLYEAESHYAKQCSEHGAAAALAKQELLHAQSSAQLVIATEVNSARAAGRSAVVWHQAQLQEANIRD